MMGRGSHQVYAVMMRLVWRVAQDKIEAHRGDSRPRRIEAADRLVEVPLRHPRALCTDTIEGEVESREPRSAGVEVDENGLRTMATTGTQQSESTARRGGEGRERRERERMKSEM